ncbi:MAG: hypothetical protein ACTSX6_12960 [Candidatus Heimdallarchaeaceae archaeon]
MLVGLLPLHLIDIGAGSYFPILPYLGFGITGAYFGLVLAVNPTKKKLLIESG